MSEELPLSTSQEQPWTRERVVAELRRADLLDADAFDALVAQLPVGPWSVARFGKALIAGGLTAFQVSRLFQDRARELRVGPYRLSKLLGEGGMGQVYEARHRALGKVVALKVLHADRASPQDAAWRFLREVRAVSQLSHPHVVAALDAGESEGVAYLVLEYIEGQDLGRMVRDGGPLSVPAACEYARQAALALQHAHEHGLVHRDVKPSNLMVTVFGDLKLLDLGLARPVASDEDDAASLVSSALGGTGVVGGTPDYVAPEQVRDPQAVDIRADLYSLGCTLYHLISGRPPFAGMATMQKLLAHQADEPPSLDAVRDDVPAVVAAFVRRLMAKNPEDRYRTPGEAAEVLGRLLREDLCEVGSAFENVEATAERIEPR